MSVTVRLQGGLGNQLFQYAAARQLAHLHSTDLVLDTAPLDRLASGSRDSSPARKFDLGAMRIKGATSSLDSWRGVKRFRIRVGGRLPADLARWCGVFREPHFHFAPCFFSLPREIYLIGFFQSEKYFSGVAADLLHELQPRERSLYDRAQEFTVHLRRPRRPLVSVHVRRADYLQRQACLSSDYYASAMGRFGPNTDYLLFSDDLAWCRENFQGDNIFLSDTGNAVEDFVRMTLCDHHIIANSTFSWWGAWLNPKVNKLIVAPKQWFGRQTKHHDTKDLLPPDWIVL